jgi:hypothetical protein
MNATEVAAIVGPVTTLLAGLGVVELTQRYQHRRDLQEAKQAAYLRWVQFAENIGPGATPVDWDAFNHDINDRQAEINLVAPREVRQAVQSFLDGLGSVLDKVNALPRTGDRPEQVAVDAAFRMMGPHKGRVFVAMRNDLGFGE